jgi:putative Mg2+ transporter-C (MgtC) family protein
MVGAYGLGEFENDLRFRVDPTRIAAQVVTGIGFLGAGAILQKGIRVRGLTTAAALWVTAAIGMAAGLGYWPGAIGAAIISLIALAVLKAMQQRLFGFVRSSAHLMFDVPQGWDMPRFEDTVRKAGGRIRKIEMGATLEGHRVSVTLDSPHVGERLAEAIADLPDISRLEWR